MCDAERVGIRRAWKPQRAGRHVLGLEQVGDAVVDVRHSLENEHRDQGRNDEDPGGRQNRQPTVPWTDFYFSRDGQLARQRGVHPSERFERQRANRQDVVQARDGHDGAGDEGLPDKSLHTLGWNCRRKPEDPDCQQQGPSRCNEACPFDQIAARLIGQPQAHEGLDREHEKTERAARQEPAPRPVVLIHGERRRVNQ